MYDYDRQKTARRGVAEDIEAIQEAINAAKETMAGISKYIQDVSELYHFLQIKPDLGDAQKLLMAATHIVQELPPILAVADQLDDAIEAYARVTRRNMPRNRETIDASNLAKKMVQEFQRRAKPLVEKLKKLSTMADEAPTGFEIDDPYDSPRVMAINSLAEKLNELSVDIVFDAS